LGILVVVIGIVLGGLLLKNKGYVTNVNLKSTQVPSPSASVKVSTRTYVVQEGEGLFEIAEKIYGNGDLWTKIAEANKLSNPDQIEAGTKLIIPRE
jgi:nucleoid-associated protein YgaU